MALARTALAFLALALASPLSPLHAETAANPTAPLTFHTKAGSRTFTVERALNEQARERGLMFRREMADDHGMIFDFEGEKPVDMWMHNTYIPLDMVFIGADRAVKRVARNTTPLSDKIISSEGPALYVVELNGGEAHRAGIEPGDKVSGPALEK
ncbi:hypothetical protein SAMN05216548_11950 [Faunimonas pinastri]|uniref:DUF192 domain-containing protein n=1 Tax=Faunimonas pinastri TaxID=1855383 RepID=A0A1H9PCN6_9HYPH|nr:DUF192 domain-containing protein [Faunimonas pinastri]SER46034.1 hypothetical protein SAMN05216548_11950 [Faunimonas pinastri]